MRGEFSRILWNGVSFRISCLRKTRWMKNANLHNSRWFRGRRLSGLGRPKDSRAAVRAAALNNEGPHAHSKLQSVWEEETGKRMCGRAACTRAFRSFFSPAANTLPLPDQPHLTRR